MGQSGASPRAFDECPNCGGRMVEAWTDCADDDPECDCDAAWDCPTCGHKYIDPCGAHTRSYESSEREPLDDV